MKGKTTCPKCKNEIVKDMPDDTEKHTIDCPNCNHSFVIKKVSSNDHAWEEYGEPRKTILSSIKKKTNKPVIASFLLLTTGVLGFFTAVINSSRENLNIQQIETITSNLSWLPFGNIALTAGLIIFSIFAIIGFITVFKRRYFLFSAICAFLSIFSIGLIVGIILAIIALELIVTSRDEFENGTKGKVF
jgi:DNA-directed RNA polymerase subunit RPC12/RpoP